jgi:hypothetical protein
MPSIAITTSSRPNYIAHDLLFDDHRFEAEYTPDERSRDH